MIIITLLTVLSIVDGEPWQKAKSSSNRHGRYLITLIELIEQVITVTTFAINLKINPTTFEFYKNLKTKPISQRNKLSLTPTRKNPNPSTKNNQNINF
jgi:hypothetical protein